MIFWKQHEHVYSGPIVCSVGNGSCHEHERVEVVAREGSEAAARMPSAARCSRLRLGAARGQRSSEGKEDVLASRTDRLRGASQRAACVNAAPGRCGSERAKVEEEGYGRREWR
eukprot:814428-Pleurochrysis_carterae.AAC.1